jgi:hypothetical protein
MPKAQLLRFPAKRGRPRSTRPSTDTGTPELLLKKLQGQTRESLDACLERKLISSYQHWCGMHLRWLHTLRHGAPGVRALDLSTPKYTPSQYQDSQWRQEREQEYQDAVLLLQQRGLRHCVLAICVFNEPALFLKQHNDAARRELQHLQEGLELLAVLWASGQKR